MRRAAQLLPVSRGRGSCRGLARRGRTLGPHFVIWVWGQRHFDPRSAARGIFLSFGSETCDILGSRAAVLTMKNKVAAREAPGHSFVPPNPSSGNPAARPAKMSEQGRTPDKNHLWAAVVRVRYCQEGSPRTSRRCLCFASKSPMRNRIGLPSARATESAIFLVSLVELSCNRPTVMIR